MLTFGLLLSLCVSVSVQEILINELNADNPSVDTKEYVELVNTGAVDVSLDDHYLVFYNGVSDPVDAYLVMDLYGHTIQGNGYFLVGSAKVTPLPDIALPSESMIQNGDSSHSDAVALYQLLPAMLPLTTSMSMTSAYLLDAVVYSRYHNSNASLFFPGLMSQQMPLVEDSQHLFSDEGLSRCDNEKLTLSAFIVMSLTPGKPNACNNGESNVKVSTSGSLYQIIKGKKASGVILKSSLAPTVSACSLRCTAAPGCIMINYSEEAGMWKCDLLLSFTTLENDLAYDVAWIPTP